MNEKDVQLEIEIRKMVAPLANLYGVELAPLVEAFKLGDAHGWAVRAESEFANTWELPTDHGDPKDWVWINDNHNPKHSDHFYSSEHLPNWFNEEAGRARQSEIDQAFEDHTGEAG